LFGVTRRNAESDRIIHRLKEGETAQTVAKQLTLMHYRASDEGSDFNRPLRYDRWGLA